MENLKEIEPFQRLCMVTKKDAIIVHVDGQGIDGMLFSDKERENLLKGKQEKIKEQILEVIKEQFASKNEEERKDTKIDITISEEIKGTINYIHNNIYVLIFENESDTLKLILKILEESNNRIPIHNFQVNENMKIMYSYGNPSKSGATNLENGLEGKMLSDVYPPEIVTLYEEATKKILSKKSNMEEVNYSIPCSDGSEKYYRTMIYPDLINNGKIVSVRNISFDITDLKQNAIQLNNEKELLLNISSLLVHDVRSPLSAIMVYSQMITSVNEIKKYKLDILKAADRIKNMLEEFESFRNERIRFSNIDLTNLLDQIIVNNESHAERKKQKIIFNKNTVDKNVVLGNEVIIQHILDNLINNAIKYSPEGVNAIINVTIENQENNIKIHIEDKGLGLTEEEIIFIFNKNAQINNKPTGGEPSNGIGLHYAHKLVTLIKGKIEVSSEGKGKGTTFTLTLPKK